MTTPANRPGKKKKKTHFQQIEIRCLLKWWYPQNTPKWSFLVGKPLVVGYHHFRKPPIPELAPLLRRSHRLPLRRHGRHLTLRCSMRVTRCGTLVGHDLFLVSHQDLQEILPEIHEFKKESQKNRQSSCRFLASNDMTLFKENLFRVEKVPICLPCQQPEWGDSKQMCHEVHKLTEPPTRTKCSSAQATLKENREKPQSTSKHSMQHSSSPRKGLHFFSVSPLPTEVVFWSQPHCLACLFRHIKDTDGRNPANQLRLVVYPIIYKVLYIPGGARISSINSMK